MTAPVSLDLRNGPAVALLETERPEIEQRIVRLLDAACTAETARLLDAGTGLVAFAIGVVEMLSYCTPIERCCIHLEIPGLEPVRATVGHFHVDLDIAGLEDPGTPDTSGRAGGTSFATGVLRIDERPVGYLAATGMPRPVADLGLLERLAAQITAALPKLVESEREQRRRAGRRIAELAAALVDGRRRETLAEIAEAFTGLPALATVVLTVDSPRHGSVDVRAGAAPDDRDAPERIATSTVVEPASGVRLTADLGWTSPPVGLDVDVVTEALDALAVGLDEAERSAAPETDADTDPLTGLGDRRRAVRALTQAHRRAEREAGSYAALLLDLDHLARVNERLGRAAGDAVLVAFAGVLARAARPTGAALRWSDEQFLVVLEASDEDTGRALGEQLLADVAAATTATLPESWRQTVSVGLAVHPQHGATTAAVLRAAEEALFAAKRAGRDTLQTADATRR